MPLEPGSVLLTDRVCIVTGAARGIGRAVALAFARFGASVAACDREVDELDAVVAEIVALGRPALAGYLDVRDGAQVAAWLDQVRDRFGRVDVLVNNAGGGFHALFEAVNEKGQDALVRENFTSVTHFVRGCLPLFPAAGASVVNITSIEAHRAAPGFAVYSAMKAAVANFSMTLALELGDRLVRVNCIAPDVIPTPGIGEPPVRTPLPRAGHVDDVAGAAVYLASDLSAFVTGTTIHVDGGNRAAGGWHRTPEGWHT